MLSCSLVSTNSTHLDSVLRLVSLLVVSSVNQDFIKDFIQSRYKADFTVYHAVFCSIVNPELLSVRFHRPDIRIGTKEDVLQTGSYTNWVGISTFELRTVRETAEELRRWNLEGDIGCFWAANSKLFTHLELRLLLVYFLHVLTHEDTTRCLRSTQLNRQHGTLVICAKTQLAIPSTALTPAGVLLRPPDSLNVTVNQTMYRLCWDFKDLVHLISTIEAKRIMRLLLASARRHCHESRTRRLHEKPHGNALKRIPNVLANILAVV